MAALADSLMTSLLDASFSVATALRLHLEQPVPTIITAARTSYPWPLHLGNSLWSIVAYRQVRDSLPDAERPGTIAAIATAFTMYAMAGGFAVCIIMLGQPPGVLQSGQILPIYVALWFAIHYCPGDLLFSLFSQPTVLFVIGNLSELDGYTTALNYMEEAFPLSRGSAVFPVLCGLSVMLAGGTSRHFAQLGFKEGLARFDDTFRSSTLFYTLLFCAYHYGAMLPCAGEMICAQRTGLYEALPLVGIARNLVLEGFSSLYPPREQLRAKAKAD